VDCGYGVHTKHTPFPVQSDGNRQIIIAIKVDPTQTVQQAFGQLVANGKHLLETL
jgi:hypothetical protein